PEIVGGRFCGSGPETVIENSGSEALVLPSVTVMRMLLYVPTWFVPGVPSSRPVDVLNDAHPGLFVILNVSVSPSGSFADGVNAYADPTVALVGGVPVIVGARFAGGAAVTVIENGGNEALALPSLTLIRMLLWVPT